MSRVAYFVDKPDSPRIIGDDHPLKSGRMALTDSLISSYSLLPRLECYSPLASSITQRELLAFHSSDYIEFLSEVTVADQRRVNYLKTRRNMNKTDRDLLNRFKKYKIEKDDTPIFEGLFEHCQMMTSGSVEGARLLNAGKADIAINWHGGAHHAKQTEASGYCYVNDVVFAIQKLLHTHKRVLYVDIDVHHGDGVEEAFYSTDRVMTVSFHQYGAFVDGQPYFPGSGAMSDRGKGAGKNYAINFPLEEGVDDQSYEEIFKTVVGSAVQHYRPGVIVLQGGADSLAHDPLGYFNLTLRGHGSCVAYCKSFGLPLLLLGGGGYNVANVARCWAFETAIALGIELSNDIPSSCIALASKDEDGKLHFPSNSKLHISPEDKKNENTTKELSNKQAAILQQLKGLPHAPSVSYDTRTSRDSYQREVIDLVDEEAKEKDAMDTSADGTVKNGRQHASEFFAHSRDQDGTTMNDKVERHSMLTRSGAASAGPSSSPSSSPCSSPSSACTVLVSPQSSSSSSPILSSESNLNAGCAPNQKRSASTMIQSPTTSTRTTRSMTAVEAISFVSSSSSATSATSTKKKQKLNHKQ